MAEAVPQMTKKDAIFSMFKKAPQLSNADIADFTGSSVSYVTRLLGARTVEPLNLEEVKKLQASRKAAKVRSAIWSHFRQSQTQFVTTYLPTKIYKNEKKKYQEEDFVNYYVPNEDKYQTTGSGEDLSGSWSQYEFLAERRIGTGRKIAWFPAEDAVREGIKFLNKKTKEVVPQPEIDTWMEDTDFLNQLAKAIYFERVYGISFLISYYSENDKEKGVLNEEVKKSEGTIVAFEALPPTVISPTDSYRSEKLDKNPQKWSLQGGLYDPQQIHYSRVRVFMSREVVNRWFGLSVFEPIWDSTIPYYQALIYLLRGFSKWGNLIPKVTIDSTDSVEDVFDKNVELVEEMKMNGTFIFPAGTTIDFANTQLATGLREMLEIWIEDMAAGSGIPVPIMMGRVVSSGLSGIGYLVAERYYWNTIKKIQKSFTDDVRAILIAAGFDMKDIEIDWNLVITKTDQQRLVDESLQLENEIMKERLIQEKVMTDRMLAEGIEPQEEEGEKGEGKDGEKGKEKTEPKKSPGNGGVKREAQQKQTDFVIDRVRLKRLEIMKGLNLPMRVEIA